MIVIDCINYCGSIYIGLINGFQISIVVFFAIVSLSQSKALFHNMLFSHKPVLMQVRFMFMLTNGSVSINQRRELSQCKPFLQISLLKQDTDSLIPWVIKKVSFSFWKCDLRRYFRYHSRDDF